MTPRVRPTLLGSVLAEHLKETLELRYAVLSKSRADQSPPTEQEATPAALTAGLNPSKNHATNSHTTPPDLTGTSGHRNHELRGNRATPPPVDDTE